MSDHGIDEENVACPNCGRPLPASRSYCPDCGYARKKIYFGGDSIDINSPKQSNVPIPWMAVISSLFFIPIATFGGCLLAMNIDSIGAPAFGAAMIIEALSIAFGLLSLVINAICALAHALRKK